MRSRFRRSHGTVVAYLALFVALGGTATAVTYVVSSNGQVGPNTISGHHPPSGEHANVIPGSVNAQDVADNSLRGADVNEATFGQVPSARLGGLGGDTDLGTCDPEPPGGTFTTCVQTGTIDLAAPTRVLIMGQVEALPDQKGVPGLGQCRVGTNGGFLGESTIEMDVEGSSQGDAAAISGVTGVVGPGPIKFGLDCDEETGGIQYNFAHLSYV